MHSLRTLVVIASSLICNYDCNMLLFFQGNSLKIRNCILDSLTMVSKKLPKPG